MTPAVALVCPYDLGVPGGVQHQVMALAAELARRDVRVTVVAPGSPGGLVPGAAFVGVGRTVGVPANGSVAPVALWPGAAVRTARALRRPAVEVVHLHEPLAPLVGPAALLAARTPVVATFHRAGIDRWYRLEAAALRPAARRITTAVAVSEAARTTAERVLGLGRVEIVPNGVRLPESGLPGPPAESPPTVVFLGRHETRKGLAVLLEAFRSVPPPARLVVAGGGPETATLRGRYGADGRISWLGPVDEAAKPPLFSSAHLVCAPSLGGESFGVVLLEAMAAGAPVVASDLPGYRLAGGDAARYVPPGDAGALARAVTELLGDPGQRAMLAAAGRRRAAEHSMGGIADRYLELYEAVAS